MNDTPASTGSTTHGVHDMSATPAARNVTTNKNGSDATDNTTTPQNERDNNNDNDNENDDDEDDEDDAKPSMPMQKRRRVTRACDECRRKKIKCDGKQPCTHCTVYSYDCTYDQPSNRRRNPAPQYIEALEQRLQKAEALLRSVLPGIELDDPKFDAHGVDQILESNKHARQRPIQPSPQRPDDDAQMKSMVDRTGSLDLDDTGNYDYHGHSSGYSFMRRFRAQFGESFLPVPQSYQMPAQQQSSFHESPKSLLSSPLESGVVYSNDLPSRQTAITLCSAAIDECCALHRPLHRPTFFKRLHAVYDTDPEHWNNDHVKFLPLLYMVMAVGCLFGQMEDDPNDVEKRAYKIAVDQGYQFFNTGKSMIDVTDCRDIMSIQTVMFMIFFLQGTAKLATCYAYVGVALRACCRLGMHRNLKVNFNCIEQEERKRIFWQVRKMDGYIGAMLGLPQMLSDEDVDQDLPTETDDENITEEMIKPMPPGHLSLMKATNAHTQLMKILHKAVRYVYPVRPQSEDTAGAAYSIKHSLIRELEKDLQQWMDDLPMQLRPSDNSDVELSRVQQLLRTSYAYVQMMMYRPFLHYVSQVCQSGITDKRSFACAAACVSVARNIVHITTEMRRRGLLAGAYWFVMYTTYFAILSLIYFVLENPDSATSKDILKDAREGRDTLAILARRSMAADRCTASLMGLFEVLPTKLNERRTSLQPGPASRKRTLPCDSQALPTHFGNMEALSDTRSPAQHRARALPHDYLAKVAKRNSMPDPTSAMASPHTYTSEPALTTSSTPSVRSLNHPQLSNDLSTVDFGAPAVVQGQLSELKNVMFPGDNPFAYGNQPISTLEDTHFSNMQDTPFSSDIMTPAYGTPNSSHMHQSVQSGIHDISQFDDTNQMNREFGRDQQPNQAPQFFDLPAFSNEPAPMHPLLPESQQQRQFPSNGLDDYWSSANAKRHAVSGLTPGGQGVNFNLDDLFGNGQGWGMGIGLGVANGESGTNPMMNTWPGQSGPSWS